MPEQPHQYTLYVLMNILTRLISKYIYGPAGIPGVIVQARYDLLCPPSSAFALATRWPDARIRMVEAAGHALEHPGVRAAVETEVARMIARLV